jgi:putative endonuclease
LAAKAKAWQKQSWKGWVTRLDEKRMHEKAEVDLMAYKDRMIIFTEVKTRTGNGFGEPEDFARVRKQRLLAEAADEYLYSMDQQGEVRFDIISVLFDRNENYTLKHMEDAFWPSSD